MSGDFHQFDFQDRVMSAVGDYLDCLKENKADADQVAALAKQHEILRKSIPDFAANTWQALKDGGKLPSSRAAVEYSPRRDGCGNPVPNIVLKVPTGGGKTWLAISSLSQIMGKYLAANTGLVLWIVPNEAIYSQTIKNLRDRQHPYRLALDRTAAGRVLIMEKNDRLNAREVRGKLCVMLLMLQSANRETRETLKVFQERGDVHGFFPRDGEQQAHQAMLKEIPNLDAYDGMFAMVKNSLGNALRVIRPVVVVDEGHRAITDLAFETLYGFNPSFVLELTATPKDAQPRGDNDPKAVRRANVLVEVTGRELDREGMIKMPLNLDSKQGSDWRATLNTALEKLAYIDRAAKTFQANTNRYIRPIMLVQVERTGADQRRGGHIHAEDVKEALLIAGFREAEIAIKTAERNDLRQPENQDLLSPTNEVRAIITKQALQEGWDCPFAYVLCSLAARSNLTAMTQLVGRILRQPQARKTGVDALDQCHVITHHADTAAVVKKIKQGLERDGLGDLVLHVDHSEASAAGGAVTTVGRRKQFKDTEIYLPKVVHVEGGNVRRLDYETDVLFPIDWRDFDPQEIAQGIPKNAQAAVSQLQRISLSEDSPDFVSETVVESSADMDFDPVHAVRMIMDIVQNPFVGWEIVERMTAALRRRKFSKAKIGKLSSLIIAELRRGLGAERDKRAEALFREKVRAGTIQFHLRLDGHDWHMPKKIETTEPEGAPQLLNGIRPLERSLFAQIYEADLDSGDERNVAIYLDNEKALSWWHRNVARAQYGLQGWRRHKVYPDFIFAVPKGGAGDRLVVLETKGDQLDNLDTDYKRKLLDFLTESFRDSSAGSRAGELELVTGSGVTVQCALILMSEWKTKLPRYLQAMPNR